MLKLAYERLIGMFMISNRNEKFGDKILFCENFWKFSCVLHANSTLISKPKKTNFLRYLPPDTSAATFSREHSAKCGSTRRMLVKKSWLKIWRWVCTTLNRSLARPNFINLLPNSLSHTANIWGLGKEEGRGGRGRQTRSVDTIDYNILPWCNDRAIWCTARGSTLHVVCWNYR